MIDLLAAALVGDRRDAEFLIGLDADVVVATALEQGVLPLLAERLAVLELGASPIAGRVRESVQRHAASDIVREHEIRRLCDSLAEAGVPALLMKGAHLAYTVYARPDLRPRLDTDVLVSEGVRHRAVDVLIQSGYEALPQADGDLFSYQTGFAIRRHGGIANVVDLHWRVANPQAFGTVLTFEDLATAAMEVKGLGRAKGPGLVDALQLACLHRVAHHRSHERLIWLQDIALLASMFGADDWRRWLTTAHQRGIGLVCRQEVARATEVLSARVPSWVIADPSFDSAEARSAPSAAFLPAGRRHADVVAQDLQLLSSWSARARLVRQHVFPSSNYMRTVYAPSSHAPLSLLYVRRAWNGARRWLARP